MSHIGEAVGPEGTAYFRTIRVANSSTFYELWNPGGSMLTGAMVVPANPFRSDVLLFCSGTGGSGFIFSYGSPVIRPFRTNVLGTNQGHVGPIMMPVTFTGPIYGYWIASSSLSASRILAYDLSYIP